MISIIDYGLGNVRAFANVYARLNIPFKVVTNEDDLEDAEKILLPGVGSFDCAMRLLHDSGMQELLNELVLETNIPVLGICVGMQIMANSSDEGVSSGLGWIDGNVYKLNPLSRGSLYIPHMGWNTISPKTYTGLMSDLGSCSRFYFLHSYYFKSASINSVLATTNYGCEFACAVQRENIYGVQFHPEKSHQWGEKVLENFARL